MRAAAFSALAISRFAKKDYEAAIELFNKERAIREKMPDKRAKGMVYRNLGMCRLQLEQFDEAMKWYQKALESADEIDAPELQWTTLQNLGWLHKNREQWDEAVDAAKRALVPCRESGNDRCEVSILKDIAHAQKKKNEPNEALKTISEAYELSIEKSGPKEQASLLEEKGDILVDIWRKEEALECYEKSLQLYTSLDDKSKIGALMGKKGYTLYFMGDYPAALKQFEKALTVFENIDDLENVADLKLKISIIYMHLGRHGEAQRILVDAAKSYRTWRNDRKRAMAHMYLGVLNYRTGDMNSAQRHFESALSISRKDGYRQGEAYCLSGLGEILARAGRPQEALDNYDQAQKIFEAEHEQLAVANMHAAKGDVLESTGKYEEALRQYTSALNIRKAIGFPASVASSLSNIGWVHYRRGQYDKALEHFWECLEVNKSVDEASGEAWALRAIGKVEAAQGKNIQVLGRFERSLKIFEDIGDLNGQAAIHADIGWQILDRGNYDRAEEHFRKSFKLKTDLKDPAGVAWALAAIGRLESLRGQTEPALRNQERALEKFREASDPLGQAQTLKNIGWLHVRTGDYDTALNCFKRALTISWAIGDLETQAWSLYAIARVYSESGLKERAIVVLEDSQRIFREIEHAGGVASVAQSLGGNYKALGRLDKAFPLFQRALTIHWATGDVSSQTWTLRNIAGVFSDWGQYSRASTIYRQCLDEFERLDEQDALANTMGEYSWVQNIRGNSDEAIQTAEEALAIFKRIRDRSGQAWMHRRMGEFQVDRGDYDKALQSYKTALSIETELGDSEGRAWCLLAMARIHSSTGSADEALRLLEEGLSEFVRLGIRSGQTEARMRIGTVYLDESDFLRAQTIFEQCLAVYREHLRDRRGAAWALDKLAEVQFARNDVKGALNSARQALLIYEELGDPAGQAFAHETVADFYGNLGMQTEAMRHLNKASDLARASKREHFAGYVDIRRGALEMRFGRKDRAMRSFQNAEKRLNKIGVPTGYASEMLNLAGLKSGQPIERKPLEERRLSWREHGLLALREGKNDDALESFGLLQQWAEGICRVSDACCGLIGRGLAYENKGDMENAKDCFSRAANRIEEMRFTVPKHLRRSFLDVDLGGFLRTEAYEGIARVLAKDGKPDRAFRWSEFTKARSFAEQIGAKTENLEVSESASALLGSITATEYALAELLRERQDACIEAQTSRGMEVDRQIETVRGRRSKLIAELRNVDPALAAARYPEPMELEQCGVHEDELVLSYDVTDSGVLVFLLKGKQCIRHMFLKKSRTSLNALVNRFLDPLRISGRDSRKMKYDKLFGFDFEAGKELYELLVRPVESLIPAGRPLVVVPDDCLREIPFGVLVCKPGGHVEQTGLVIKGFPEIDADVFFADRNPLSYQQSVTALTVARLTRKPDSSSGSTLMVLNPSFGAPERGRDSRKSRSDYSAELLDCPQFRSAPVLSGLKDGLVSAEDLPVTLMEGAQANKEILLNASQHGYPALSSYRFIIFGTHGYYDTDCPTYLEPVLAMAPSANHVGADQHLSMTEISNLKLNADVTALTACLTGQGRPAAGEGSLNIGRAFQIAGSRSVLMTLWEVEQNSAVLFMTTFFEELTAGKNKLQAMSAARDRLRNDAYNHPYFWAPYVIAGEVR